MTPVSIENFSNVLGNLLEPNTESYNRHKFFYEILQADN